MKLFLFYILFHYSCHRILNIVLCAIQRTLLYIYFIYTSVCANPKLLVYPFPSLFPLW